MVCLLRKTDVLARVHLKIQRQRILYIRLDHFLDKLHENRVLAEDAIFIHRLEINCDEKWPGHFWIDPIPALDAQDLGNFQELHPRVHHRRLHTSGRDLRLEFVENDMVNHEGKANRCFRRGAQVRIPYRIKHGLLFSNHQFMTVLSKDGACGKDLVSFEICRDAFIAIAAADLTLQRH